MNFENKGKWFNESEDTDKDMLNDEQQELAMEDDAADMLAEDELDLADEDIDDDSEDIFNDEEQVDEACKYRNEVRYIDPANLDRYSKDEIEEVTTASGEKRYKCKGGTPVQSTVQTGISKTQNKQRVIQNVPNIREGLKMLERDPELSKNYSDFGPSNDMNSGNYIAKNNETGRYEVVGHYNTDDTITILANNKKE